MFCPNCAAQNEDGHHYCRSCGLRLDAIAATLTELMPSAEVAEFLKRKKLLERLGIFSLSIAGLVGFMIIVSIAVFYKLILLGPEILFGSAFGALVLFGILGAFFFGYSKFFLELDRQSFRSVEQEMGAELSAPTDKLLPESRFEPASVTEDSTELLHAPHRK